MGEMFGMRVGRHGKKLPREAVQAPALEASKIRLNAFLSNLTQWKMSMPMTKDCTRSCLVVSSHSNHSTILWYWILLFTFWNQMQHFCYLWCYDKWSDIFYIIMYFLLYNTTQHKVVYVSSKKFRVWSKSHYLTSSRRLEENIKVG